MSLLSKLERRFGRFAVPNLTMVLIAGQVLVYAATCLPPPADQQEAVPGPNNALVEKLNLVAGQVLSGEVWRVVTFLFVPPTTYLIFAFFFWYLFFLMGTALEHTWGTLRYNVFLLLGYVATVAVSFVTPDAPTTNAFLAGSVFLAFAYLYPNFQLMLFFLLPVKVKWLAMLTWIMYFFMFATGEWMTRLAVAASVCNFLAFFGREILARMKFGHRRMTSQAARLGGTKRRVHRCTICGVSSETERNMEFRYCSKCTGAMCYCPEHLRNHQHVTEAEVPTGDRGATTS